MDICARACSLDILADLLLSDDDDDDGDDDDGDGDGDGVLAGPAITLVK